MQKMKGKKEKITVILESSFRLIHYFSCKTTDLLERAKPSCRKIVSQYFIVTFLFTEARTGIEER